MNKVIAMCTITMLMTGCILPPSRYYGDGPYYGDGLLTGLMHSARAASALAHVAIPRNSAVHSDVSDPRRSPACALNRKPRLLGGVSIRFHSGASGNLEMTTAALEVLTCIAGSQLGNVRLRLCYLTLIF